jgi:glycosyltransferase involved in cell wall biosynthesis
LDKQNQNKNEAKLTIRELMAMKKVLLIAYHFPPLGGGGVFRTVKFAKYLPEFGYQPYVLTVKNSMYDTQDLTLQGELPSEVEVHRTFSFEHRILRAPRRLLGINLKWFYIPDENIGWLPFGIFTGANLIKKENIDVIYATSPKWTSLLIGFFLKKYTKKPLVIDFRDPWTDNFSIIYPTKYHKRFERKLETITTNQADYITVAFDSIKNALIKKHPFLESRIATITNGFDPDDFKNLNTHSKTGKFTIVHVGSIYGPLTAKPFLIALKELVEEKSEYKEKLEAIFVGNYGRETPILVTEYGLEENVRFVEYVPHKKSLEFMLNSQALLLLITIEGSKGDGIIPGKLFEYLASRKPILVIASENNSAAKIIKTANCGTVVSPRSVRGIKKAISDFYEQWTEGKIFATEMENIAAYDRKILTQKLAEILDKVT